MLSKNITTALMGILNVTPDSFFDGGRYTTLEKAITQARALVDAGADILDIGGESSRPPTVYNPNENPHSYQIPLEEELQRIIPLLKALKQDKHTQSIPISIDTMKPQVAKQACALGATMINDVRGFRDEAMRKVAAATGAKICVVHMQGTPATMQSNPSYPDGVVDTLLRFFERRIECLIASGVTDKNIYLDPGIGFGKTVADNWKILQNVSKLRSLGFPLLIGVSRKIFLSKTVDKPSNALLAATLGINTALMEQGVDILRVHDIAEHHDVRATLSRLHNKYK
jgi:dihydropteroate synthase